MVSYVNPHQNSFDVISVVPMESARLILQSYIKEDDERYCKLVASRIQACLMYDALCAYVCVRVCCDGRNDHWPVAGVTSNHWVYIGGERSTKNSFFEYGSNEFALTCVFII